MKMIEFLTAFLSASIWHITAMVIVVLGIVVIKYRKEILPFFKRRKLGTAEKPSIHPGASSAQYFKGISLVLSLNESIHTKKEDPLKEYIIQFITYVRSLPFASRTVVIDMAETTFMNSTTYAHLIGVLTNVSEENGIFLKLLLKKSKGSIAFAQQMSYLVAKDANIEINVVD
jgi:anti-anti-sigma regulatory factor